MSNSGERSGLYGLLAGTFIAGAVSAAAILRWSQKETHEQSIASKDSLDPPTETATSERLGPPPADIRTPLTLRGRVDRLYDGNDGPRVFEFNQQVVEVFDDMVSRSVPLYSEAIDFLIYWVTRYYKENTHIYDFGCSTGTTLDAIVRGFPNEDMRLSLVGVDEAVYMIKECEAKLKWAQEKHDIKIAVADICSFPVENASVCILNYTLQFVPYAKRTALLVKIFEGLGDDGMLFISEKVKSADDDIQATNVWAYEDFKYRRGYSKEYIGRKKEALTDVLRPYTERQLCSILENVGFDYVQTVVKWNCFVSIVARKRSAAPLNRNESKTPALDSFHEHEPLYLREVATEEYKGNKKLNQSLWRNYEALCDERRTQYYDKGKLSPTSCARFERIAEALSEVPAHAGSSLSIDPVSGAVVIGEPTTPLTDIQQEAFMKVLTELKPWRKGPWEIMGTHIDSEWRSNLKWDRLLPNLPKMQDKVLCDLGCGNGYFMLRMLEQQPRFVIGVDPNFSAWLEFQTIRHFAPKGALDRVRLEVMRGENIHLFEKTFDVMFCLGVLYHTPDPIGVLRNIKLSMRPKGVLIVDCQGVEGEEHVALFPKRKYANMKGVYFLPTLITLQHWLKRAGYNDVTVFYAEPLVPAEQRTTDWAPVDSLKEALQEGGDKTVEGYDKPYRFYLKAKA